MAIALEPGWLEVLKDEFDKDYMVKLRQFLKEEKDAGHITYPRSEERRVGKECVP